MHDLINLIKDAYRDIWRLKQSMPDLAEVTNKALMIVSEDTIKDIGSFYLNAECYEDYERLIREGLCFEDFEVVGLTPEFDKHEVRHYLDLLRYAYTIGQVKYNLAQSVLFERW